MWTEKSRFFFKMDLEAIILKVMSKYSMSPLQRLLNCDWRISGCLVNYIVNMPYTSRFNTNERPLLTEFYVAASTLTLEWTCQAIISKHGKQLTSEHISFVRRKAIHVIVSNLFISSKLAFFQIKSRDEIKAFVDHEH